MRVSTGKKICSTYIMYAHPLPLDLMSAQLVAWLPQSNCRPRHLTHKIRISRHTTHPAPRLTVLHDISHITQGVRAIDLAHPELAVTTLLSTLIQVRIHIHANVNVNVSISAVVRSNPHCGGRLLSSEGFWHCSSSSSTSGSSSIRVHA